MAIKAGRGGPSAGDLRKRHTPDFQDTLAGTTVAMIVLQMLLPAIAASTRSLITDELDRLIELRGHRAGYLMIGQRAGPAVVSRLVTVVWKAAWLGCIF